MGNNKSLDIQNSSLILNLKDILHEKSLQQGSSDVHVRPVLIISPTRDFICRQAEAINSTSATIYTTPLDRDFYLTSCDLSILKDVTATSLGSSLKISINGFVAPILRIIGLTLTAQTNTSTLSLSTPIKIDRNSNIVVTNGTNNANISASGCITGYLI